MIASFGDLNKYKTVLNFMSTQWLFEESPTLANFIIPRVLFVVVDEIYLENKFGESFKQEFGQMKNHLFYKWSNCFPFFPYRKLYCFYQIGVQRVT